MINQTGLVSYLVLALILSLNLVVLTGFANESSLDKKQTIPEIDSREYENTENATFALGCFWGGESRFGAVPGVVETKVGYAGGDSEDPTYRDIGDHTESIRIVYNPNKVTFEELVEIFWAFHDPFSESYNTQYEKILFYHNNLQQEVAEESRQELAEENDKEVTTSIQQLNNFYVAEDYHQKYRLRGNEAFKEDLMDYYGDPDEFRDSTAAARLNGYLAGYGTPDQVKENIGKLGLSPKNQDKLAANFGLDRENTN